MKHQKIFKNIGNPELVKLSEIDEDNIIAWGGEDGCVGKIVMGLSKCLWRESIWTGLPSVLPFNHCLG